MWVCVCIYMFEFKTQEFITCVTLLNVMNMFNKNGIYLFIFNFSFIYIYMELHLSLKNKLFIQFFERKK